MGKIVVATDGSCLTNPGFAGWAWFVDDDNWRSGSIKLGTNQVAELSGLLYALNDLPTGEDVLLISDSQYAIKCASVWLPGWKRNGWKTSSGGDVKNQELIKGIDEALALRKAEGSKTDFEWVKGHKGHLLNEAADLLCGKAAREAQAGNHGEFYGPGYLGVAADSLTRQQASGGLPFGTADSEKGKDLASFDLRLFENW